MNAQIIPQSELRQMLVDRGHCITDTAEFSAEVYPPSDKTVTVALNLDPAVRSEFRTNYYCTFVDHEYVPELAKKPEFALPMRFIAASRRGGGSWGRFMAGPVRWLFVRLEPLHQVLLWPDDEIWRPTTFVEPSVLEKLPSLRQLLTQIDTIPSDGRGITLELSDPLACSALWEIAEECENGFNDFFVGDITNNTVYTIHHHSRIEISIPDDKLRQALLAELNDKSEVLENCSHYTLGDIEDWDDESD